AVFRAMDIQPDPVTGEPVCPRVQFAANGLPMPVLPICDDPDPFACARVPAVGGRTYYHPGDDETVVDLGCTNLEQLTDAAVCIGENRVTVNATVNDFDDAASVDKTVADRLNVDIGEPKPFADTYVLGPEESDPLERSTASTPSWGALIERKFMNIACIAVREDGAQTTTALTCNAKAVTENDYDSLLGYYLRKATLAQILSAIGMTEFPAQGGLVVGMVVDENFNPRAGEPVSCPAGCTLQYLNNGRTGVITGGVTSASGIFVSTDAPFGTQFSLPTSPQRADTIGGVVEGKVTIVVLQYRELEPL
ncbi:MAG TPA: hypothetical protein VMZ53_04550, partial [Kofleriaceae bacterium]|nr:hypothetical protein [Kofleriaceae bacterium]